MSAPGERVALVSGGNRGIGLAVVRGLAAAGVSVVLGSRDSAAGQAARATIAEGDALVHVSALDVRDPRSVASCVAAVERDLGRLDVLVNNAGVVLDSGARAVEPELDLAGDTLETNLFGAWRLASAAIPVMRANGGGRIVNVSSGMGQLSEMGGGAPGYRVSKAALNALTRMLAAELGAGFSVNSVCPGWVRTDLGGAGSRLTVARRTRPHLAVDTRGRHWRRQDTASSRCLVASLLTVSYACPVLGFDAVR
jgi:NAD(P)-dependent dehydrogenase (short-subunit alcohol dehydrogenase family)